MIYPVALGALLLFATGGAEASSRAGTEAQLRDAWGNPLTKVIRISKDIALRDCESGDPIRESSRPIRVVGNGHTIRQTCFETRLLRQDGTGFVQLENITLKRGGSDGPGAAVTTRGEIKVLDSRISENLAEEPGGGIFSMRRAVIIRSVMTGNLANDDGGAVYARRGGVLVKDSAINGNLVDGSGGAIGSTGDIKVVRSQVDGNTTDGDGGALYADEDGDVTVIDSSVSGNTADGPGGAIFTLDGDVTVVRSVLNGNRADDRGGAISGVADVFVLNSTLARNVAEAHSSGGIWARGDMYVTGSTVSNNRAEGQGGGILGAGDVSIAYSTIADNTAPGAVNVGAGARLRVFGSVIGPPGQGDNSGEANCRASTIVSSGYSVSTDNSCGLRATGDTQQHLLPLLGGLLANGGLGESRLPLTGSLIVDAIPQGKCPFVPFGSYREGEQHLAGSGVNPVAPVVSDQRGAVRPFGPGCDVGSIERGEEPQSSRLLGTKSKGPAWFEPEVPDATRLQATAGGQVPRGQADGRSPALRLLERKKKDDVTVISSRLQKISRVLKPMERSVARYRSWRRCITEVGASEEGDPDHRYGFVFDEIDGSGRGFETAIALDRKGKADYRFLDFADRRGCRSARTVVGGTADAARAVRSGAFASATPTVGELERDLAGLADRADVVERSAGRFDDWESCLTWLPVTQFGDPDRRFGYATVNGRKSAGYSAAIAVDNSAWDDPDYQLLVFAGSDQPGRRGCEGDGAAARLTKPYATEEDGSEVRAVDDETDAAEERIEDLDRDTDELFETVLDLREPAYEFESFDQCMYTIGMTQYGKVDGKKGYLFKRKKRYTKAALALDLYGLDRARYNFMASSGEEPPQIECNEDAGGFDTDE